MHALITQVQSKFLKKEVVDVRSGDTVRVHQRIKEGNKERIQVFEGLVIRTDRKGGLTSTITVRRIASGVGVEKSFLLHSPLVEKVEVTKRSKVRRNYLSYMRARSGKSARLAAIEFDKNAVNTVDNSVVEAEIEAPTEDVPEAIADDSAAETTEAETNTEKPESVSAEK